MTTLAPAVACLLPAGALRKRAVVRGVAQAGSPALHRLDVRRDMRQARHVDGRPVLREDTPGDGEDVIAAHFGIPEPGDAAAAAVGRSRHLVLRRGVEDLPGPSARCVMQAPRQCVTQRPGHDDATVRRAAGASGRDADSRFADEVVPLTRQSHDSHGVRERLAVPAGTDVVDGCEQPRSGQRKACGFLTLASPESAVAGALGRASSTRPAPRVGTGQGAPWPGRTAPSGADLRGSGHIMLNRLRGADKPLARGRPGLGSGGRADQGTAFRRQRTAVSAGQHGGSACGGPYCR